MARDIACVRLPRLLRTTSFRLAALFALIFGISTIVVGSFVYINVKAALDRQERTRIQSDALALKGEFDSGGMPDLMDAIKERERNKLAGGLDYSLFTAKGGRIVGRLPTPRMRAGWRHVNGPPDGDEPPGELEHLLVYSINLSPNLWLSVGDDIGLLRRLDNTFLQMFVIGLVLAITLAVGGGIVVSAGFLRRIDAITRTAEAIIEGDIGKRIVRNGSGDDLDRLAASLNRMLDRIGLLMDALRNVSTDVAHDLRTPLGHLRQQLENARGHARSTGEYAQAVDSAIAKTDSILETFSAILRIAQIESGSRKAGFRRINLSEIVASLVQSYSPTAEEQRRPLSASIAPDVSIDGDRELIIQLVVNLLDNAMRHTPPGTPITVNLAETPDTIALEVADKGPGVPEAERERILERFYRCETSRSTPGSGLGLSLVSAVSGLHRATIHVMDNMPGLKFRIEFLRTNNQGAA
ncbi:MAG TPA: HAMP domain-containing sensor histidine kinase [Rhizomicrobium sp.]